jgi:hypothetical protein
MIIRQIDRAAAQLDLRRFTGQAGDEGKARRDRLAAVSGVFAYEGFAITQAIGQQDGRAVFFQRLGDIAPGRMHRHGEKSESHDPPAGRRL